MAIDKIQKRLRRRARVRAKISGTKKCPRLSIFRSNKHIYAQLIDDEKGETLMSFGDLKLEKESKPGKRIGASREVGKRLGGQILKGGCKEIVFDRGGYKYHGRVKSLAEGVREAGVKF